MNIEGNMRSGNKVCSILNSNLSIYIQAMKENKDNFSAQENEN